MPVLLILYTHKKVLLRTPCEAYYYLSTITTT